MRHMTTAGLALALLLAGTASHAQVDYNDIKAGTLLDARGIKIGAFIKPIPLPQGEWLVVSRDDQALTLSGGRAETGPSTTGAITLTLKSTDPHNGIAAMLVGFTPDSTPVRWMGEYCTNKQFPIVDNLGTEPNATTSACAEGQWYAGSFRNLVKVAATHPTKFIQTYLGGLTPYAAEMPDAHAAILLSARRDRGRSLNFTVYARLPANFRPSGRFDTQVREWVHSAGLALLNMVSNREGAMPAFPVGDDAPAISTSPGAAPPPRQPPALISTTSGTQG